MSRTLFALASVALPALASLGSAQGKVWVVDDDDPTRSALPSIQLAVDAACDGDAVLVRPGAYGPFEVFDKDLVVVAESGAAVASADGEGPAVSIAGLAAHRRVLILGLDVQAGAGVPVALTDNRGAVWLEDARLDAGSFGAALRASDSHSVTLTRCDLAGAVVQDGGYLAFFDGSAAAVTVAEGRAFVSGSVLTEQNGAALALEGAAAEAALLGTTIALGGAVVDPFGAVEVVPGQARSVDATSLLREGETGAIVLHGVPGERVPLGVGVACRLVFPSEADGPAAVFPETVLRTGVLPPAGSRLAEFTAGAVPEGDDFQVGFAQAAFLDQAGIITLGAPASVVVLAARF
ncbi:MAG: hypothetical protein AAF682_11540 [Planctomycetota bacterium]